MTAPKHTPGPWLFDGEVDHNGQAAITYRDRDNWLWDVALCRPDPGPRGETAEANAHLIAAAPELYEALAPFAEFERVRSAMGGNTAKDGVLWAVNSSAGSAEITAEDLRRAIAALAKARGEA